MSLIGKMGQVKRDFTENPLNIDWRGFYKSIFALLIPMAVQNLVNVGVTAADVIMLGKVGEEALSGASLAGQVQFIMVLFLFGLTSGATVLTAQYWGKGDKKTIEKIMGLGMKAAVVVTAVFALAALFLPETLMKVFTKEPAVIEQGVGYLRIVAFSYVLMGITQVYLYIMRSVERVVVATVVYLISLICNVILNAIFIFGLFGSPAMGVQGAALGTLISRCVELVLVFGYAKIYNKDIQFHFRYFLHTDKELVKDFLKYAMPVIINEVLWGTGVAANTAILGHLGSAAVAANSVAQVARQLATVVAFGTATATAIYLGKTIGERKFEHAKVYARHFWILSVVVGTVGGLLVLLASPFVGAALTLSSSARGYLRLMFFVMSYFVVAQSFNTTMIVGTFRSGGDTRFALIIDVISMWFGSILFGWLAAFVFKLSVPVVYIILMSDELLKVPISWLRYRSYKWLKDVTR